MLPALVEVEVYVKAHHRYRDVDEDTCYPWFLISCTADLAKNTDDLRIQKVEQYNQKNKQNKPLSDSLVPISYKIDLEKTATDFLRKHYPEALETPMPVDPMVLANRLGLTVITHELTGDFSVFGQIFFADCDTKVFNSSTGEMETVHFRQKQSLSILRLSSCEIWDLLIIPLCMSAFIGINTAKPLNWSAFITVPRHRSNVWSLVAPKVLPIVPLQTGWSGRQIPWLRASRCRLVYSK